MIIHRRGNPNSQKILQALNLYSNQGHLNTFFKSGYLRQNKYMVLEIMVNLTVG